MSSIENDRDLVNLRGRIFSLITVQAIFIHIDKSQLISVSISKLIY